MADQILLSYLEQTAYFAALRQGIQILDAEDVQGRWRFLAATQ